VTAVTAARRNLTTERIGVSAPAQAPRSGWNISFSTAGMRESCCPACGMMSSDSRSVQRTAAEGLLVPDHNVLFGASLGQWNGAADESVRPPASYR
jgi:hypothetical protein